MKPSWTLLLALSVALGLSRIALSDDRASEHFFETQVRPLLARRCLECHGSEKQQGGLRLDSRAAMLAGVDGTPAMVPGQPAQSRLLQVLRYDEDDTQMPPDGKLPDEEIAILTNWIAAGGHWPEHSGTETPNQLGKYPRTQDGEIDFAAAAAAHWAYQPIRKPVPPQVNAVDRVQSPIDRFVLERLEAEGLSYSPPADRRTLLRRAGFDLVGLPPTIHEVQAFEVDDSRRAWETQLERLLASPAYGQRWGRHWLDVARYADTKGYVFTQNPKYPYAYTYRDYVIRAFNEDKPFDRFIIEQLAVDRLDLPTDNPDLAALGFLTVGPRLRGNVHDIIDDRLDVIMRGTMAMTLACARCHDHKYDPIPIDEYYSLYGVLSSSEEPDHLPVIGQPDDTPEYRAYVEELDKRQQAVDDYIQTTHADLLNQAREHVADYLLAVVKMAGKVPDGVDIAYSIEQPRDNLTKLWALTIAHRVKENDPVFLPWGAFAALSIEDFSQEAARLIKNHADAADADSSPVNQRVWDALQAEPPQSMVDVARLYGRLLSEADEAWKQTATAAGDDLPATLADPGQEQLRRILTGPGSITELTVDERLFERDHRDHVTNLRRKVSEWHAESPGAPPRAMLLVDKDQPVSPVVFLRGSPGRRGPQVPRRFPRIVAGADSPEFTDGSGRLELARAIVSPENPLTARVIVNRVWRHHFGTPLVATPSDFGTRSDPPTHPELLDWLAASLIEHDWSLKWLHREIMRSAAYQQASLDRPEARQIDAENRLYWRMNRRRLEFEPMRDAMLFVAGRLDPAVGGRPINIDESPESARRTVYSFIDRNNFSPLLRTFDYPSPDVHSPGRPLTSVPQQALYGMNAPFPRQMAEQIAHHPDVQSAAEPGQTVDVLYQMILARDPTSAERELGATFLSQSQDTVQFAQALLLTNEFLFVD